MKHPPRNIVIDWLNTVWSTDLPSNAKLVACNLRRYMNSQNDMAWPSVARIAGECSLSERSVQRSLQLLCSEGWLTHSGTSNVSTRIYQACTPVSISGGDSVTGVTHSHSGGDSLTPKLNNELNNTLSKRFSPPTLEQLKAYQAEKGFNFDPEAFIDYWASVGWKRGRTPMKDWKATARNWARQERNGQKRSGTNSKPTNRKRTAAESAQILRDRIANNA